MAEVFPSRQEQNQDDQETNTQIANGVISTFDELSFRATFLGSISVTEFEAKQIIECHTLHREDTPDLYYKIILSIGGEPKLELFKSYISDEVRLFSLNPHIVITATPNDSVRNSWIVGKREDVIMTDEEIKTCSESFFKIFDHAIAGYEQSANISEVIT
jgi:hypothetical protein